MRIVSEFETQFKLGQSSLSKIKLDYTSRNDITRLLLGLQSIPLNKEAQAKIFQILEKRRLFRISWGCYANNLYPLRSRNNLLKNDSGFDKP